MSHEIKADRTQTFLLPPSLDDWIPHDHPARFIAEFVEALDLPSLGFPVGHSPTGRPSFSSELLLSVVCYCYYSRIRSMRGMEQACLENVALMWLTGNQHPDHNTIWKFFSTNRKSIRGLLKKSARVAADSGLVGMVLHAVDGTKIQAQASMKTGLYRKPLESALKRIDTSIAEMEASIDASRESGLSNYRLPKELSDKKSRREAIVRSLARLEESEADKLHPVEPDARIMLCEKKKVFGYNAQAVVDDKLGIIVAEDVVTQENDHGLLAKMIDRVEETMGSVGETTLADKGYSAEEDLAEAKEKGRNVLVNLTKTVDPKGDSKPFHASRFEYDVEENCCICPLGKKLNFQRFKKDKNGEKTIAVYHCTSYKECPDRWTCSKNKRGRTVELSKHRAAVAEQRQKQKDPEAKELMARRAVIAEPPFAFAKAHSAFRRWTLRTYDGVRAQWSLICITHNLRKLHKKWVNGEVVFG